MFRLLRRIGVVLLVLAIIAGFSNGLGTLLGGLLGWSLTGYLLWRAWPSVRQDSRSVALYVRGLVPLGPAGVHARRGGTETL